jgi:hypothetical protein
MKQHITVEQLYEFIENENKGFIDKRIDAITDLVGKHYSTADIAERMNIGKMLEILESKSNYTQQLIHEGGRYCISINLKQFYTTAWETEYYNEPCDALWEAVKHVL